MLQKKDGERIGMSMTTSYITRIQKQNKKKFLSRMFCPNLYDLSAACSDDRGHLHGCSRRRKG